MELKDINTIFPSMSDILTDFHKNASFPSNMLNYFNMTFTFGKQIKNNFINRKVECRSTYSFTYFRARFSYGESRGGSSLRMTGNTSRSTALSDSSAGSTPRRDQARSRCSDAIWSLDEL